MKWEEITTKRLCMNKRGKGKKEWTKDAPATPSPRLTSGTSPRAIGPIVGVPPWRAQEHCRGSGAERAAARAKRSFLRSKLWSWCGRGSQAARVLGQLAVLGECVPILPGTAEFLIALTPFSRRVRCVSWFGWLPSWLTRVHMRWGHEAMASTTQRDTWIVKILGKEFIQDEPSWAEWIERGVRRLGH